MSGRVRLAARTLEAAACLLLVLELFLWWRGSVPARTLLALLLVVEAPLLIGLLVLHLRLFRRLRSTLPPEQAFAQLARLTPPLHAIRAEARLLAGLVAGPMRLVRGRHRRPGAVPYAGGSRAALLAVLTAAVLETAVLALLPLPGRLHAVLLVLSLYGILVIMALLLWQLSEPHTLRAGELVLRAGPVVLARVRPAAIAEAQLRPGGGTRVGSADGVLTAGSMSGTNVVLRLREEVECETPRLLRSPHRERVREIRLWADDPEALVTALREGPEVADEH